MAIREFEEPITLLCLYKSVLLRGQCLLNNKDRDFRLS
jgi:predicted DNA-binding transcriptional regulator YafY